MTREKLLRYGKEYLCDLETACCKIGELHLNFVRESIKALEREQCEDAVSRQAVLDKKELVQLEDGQSFYCISPEDVETLPSVTPKPKTGHWIYENYSGLIDGIDTLEQEPILDKIRAEIKEWYWNADKQALAEDPCVVDAMIDLFIRTIDKYKAEGDPQESEDKE